MAILNKPFDQEFISCITEYLEAAFAAREALAIVGQTISIGYKDGQYHVSKIDLKDKTLTVFSFRQAELDDAVGYFLQLYKDDPIADLDPEDSFYARIEGNPPRKP